MSDEMTETDNALLELLLEDADTHAEAAPDVDLTAPFPLTDIQRGYLLGRDPAMPLGGVACQFYYELVCAELCIERYLGCWDTVIARHPMMRISVDPSSATQRIQSPQTLRSVIHDVSHETDVAANAKRDEVRARLSRDLPTPNAASHVLGIEFTRMPSGACHIHLQFDLIACDQQSILILLQETAALYRDENTTLPTIQTTFPSYLTMLKAQRHKAREKALDYWQNNAASMPEAPALPYKCAPENAGQAAFERYSAEIDPVRWQMLQGVASRNGLTTSTLLLECFGQLLRRWSSQDRFALNLTIFDRQPIVPDIGDIVGDFTTNLLFDMDMRHASQISRSEMLKRQQDKIWRDLEHIAVSGVEVAGMLGRAKGQLDGVLMPVVYTATLTDGDAARIAAASDQPGDPVCAFSQTPQVVLDNQVMAWNGTLRVNWDVAVNVLPDNIARAMFDEYISAILAISDTPDALDKPITLTDPAPIQDTPTPKRIADDWLARLATQSKDIAIGTSDGTLTHARLAALVAHIVEGLKARDVTTGATVAVIMEKSVLQIASVLACSILGATFVPIDKSQPNGRKAEILKSLRPDLVVSDDSKEVESAWLPDVTGSADPTLLYACDGPDAGALAYIIFTSGSTGKPKGVMISHQAAQTTIDDVSNRFCITAEDRVLGLSEMHFDLAIYDIFGVLGQGGAVILPDADRKQDPSHWAELCARYKVSLWNTVPGLFDLYLDYLETARKPPSSKLKTVMLSGDWIGLDVPARTWSLWPETVLYSLGGATEAAIWSIYYPVTEVAQDWESIPYGSALTGQSVHILNANLEVAPPGVTGDIYIGGLGLADGYFADDDKTKAAFITHPRTGARLYRTGDLGCCRTDGIIVFQGRADDQIKINGYRLELGEVQHKLSTHPEVTECLAMSYHKGTRQRLVAFLQGHVSEAVIRAHAEENLPAYMIPDRLVFLDKFPLTSNGKINRKALLASMDQRADTAVAKAPADLAHTVCEMVGDVLKRAPATMDDNLVSLGAGSLELIALANRIEALTGTRPALTSLARSIEMPDLVALVASVMPKTVSDMSAKAEANGTALSRWLARNPTISDPLERQLFKTRRSRPVTVDALALPRTDLQRVAWRQSHRAYSESPVALEALAGLLQVLARTGLDTSGHPTGSAGGLFPVQPQLIVPEGGVTDLAPGVYTYEALAHSLRPTGGLVPDDVSMLSIGNTDWLGAARFLICFVLDLDVIAPLYDTSSLSFGLIETGAMCQLLETHAAQVNLGLCQIGDLSEHRMANVLGLPDTKVFLHALAGGEPIESTSAQQNHIMEEGTL